MIVCIHGREEHCICYTGYKFRCCHCDLIYPTSGTTNQELTMSTTPIIIARSISARAVLFTEKGKATDIVFEKLGTDAMGEQQWQRAPAFDEDSNVILDFLHLLHDNYMKTSHVMRLLRSISEKTLPEMRTEASNALTILEYMRGERKNLD